MYFHNGMKFTVSIVMRDVLNEDKVLFDVLLLKKSRKALMKGKRPPNSDAGTSITKTRMPIQQLVLICPIVEKVHGLQTAETFEH
jgi:hypothetical protein